MPRVLRRNPVRNPSSLIPPATYGVTSGPPEVNHSPKWTTLSGRQAQGRGVHPSGARSQEPRSCQREREFFIDNLLARIHFIIVMIRWTGLAPRVPATHIFAFQVPVFGHPTRGCIPRVLARVMLSVN